MPTFKQYAFAAIELVVGLGVIALMLVLAIWVMHKMGAL
jgi:Tfp pilus assembly protein FimT